MSHSTFARCVSLGVIWGSTDLACLLPVLAAGGTEINLTAPSFPGAHILEWRIAMEINNYKTRLKDKADWREAGGQGCMKEVKANLVWGYSRKRSVDRIIHMSKSGIR